MLAGDPNQLGPVNTSHVAKANGIDISLLERIMTRCPAYAKQETPAEQGEKEAKEKEGNKDEDDKFKENACGSISDKGEEENKDNPKEGIIGSSSDSGRGSSLSVHSPASEEEEEEDQPSPAKASSGRDPRLITKLVRNFRSHPGLLSLPSKLFYDDELLACVAADGCQSLCGLPWLPKPGFPVVFHGVVNRHTKGGGSGGTSLMNAKEVDTIMQYVAQLVK